MRILIVGATGTIGVPVVQALEVRHNNPCPSLSKAYVLNPRFPPTILVSLTTSQVLKRPPEVT
jgi:hypothetical protein